MGPSCRIPFPVVGERSNNMEKQRKCVLEKRLTAASAIIGAILMVGLGFGAVGTTDVKASLPEGAGIYGINQGNHWIDIAANENGEYVDGYYRCWTFWSPECWVLNMNHSYARAHDFADWTYWNRSINYGANAIMMWDSVTDTYWNHANPNTNNFLVYPGFAYATWFNAPAGWFEESPGPPTNDWSYGIEMALGGPNPHSDHLYNFENAWSELAANSNNFVGMVGIYGWFEENTKYASFLGYNNLYVHGGAHYAGSWAVGLWDTANQAWYYWYNWEPVPDYVLHPHMALKLNPIDGHAHLCWAPLG